MFFNMFFLIFIFWICIIYIHMFSRNKKNVLKIRKIQKNTQVCENESKTN